jgi:hypothetical protein
MPASPTIPRLADEITADWLTTALQSTCAAIGFARNDS